MQDFVTIFMFLITFQTHGFEEIDITFGWCLEDVVNIWIKINFPETFGITLYTLNVQAWFSRGLCKECNEEGCVSSFSFTQFWRGFDVALCVKHSTFSRGLLNEEGCIVLVHEILGRFRCKVMPTQGHWNIEFLR